MGANGFVIYIAGIPDVRAVAFVASLTGLFDIAKEVLGGATITPPPG